ncbi:MAG: GWxTD domain-containing protein [candidate division WOR-3 bacterium]|jgi:GWxTD domain-containing protein
MTGIISVLVFLSSSLPPVFSGNMKINADYLVYEDSGTGRMMELFYEIPFNSLTFIRTDTGFVARYRITMELTDRQNRIIVAEVWERQLLVANYRQTVNRDSFASGMLRLPVPESATGARVSVYDLSSERRGRAQFAIATERAGMWLRLMKSAQPNPSRSYGINDTIEIVAEFERTSAGDGNDSILWLIKKGRKVVTGSRTAVRGSLKRRYAVFSQPVNDAGLFASGVYGVEAKLVRGNLTGRAEFRIDLPFFYDDSMWQAKVEQLLYVARVEEMRRLKRTPRAERQLAWTLFWQDKDPNPSTAINEAEEEYFARIAYCEEHFGRGDRGYRSDRARVYCLYGPPDQVESRPFEIDRPAEEIWYYYQKNLTFVFVDRFGSGEFVILRQ